MQEAIWIVSGIGWGFAAGFVAGLRRGAGQAPAELAQMRGEVDDALDRLTHKMDRDRKRAAAAATEQPTPAGEVLPADRKSDLRRRAAAQGFGLSRVVNGGNGT